MSENQIVRVIGGIPAWSDNIVNSNLEDPLVVDNITSNVSTTPNSIIDTLASSGTAGQFLQKSDPANTLVWGSSPPSTFVSGKRIMISRPAMYSFSTAGGIVAFNSNVNSSGYTLVSNAISVNGSGGNEAIKVEFWANVVISDSSTQFRFDLVAAAPTVTLATCKTQLIQAGALNEHTSVYMSYQGLFSPTGTIFVNTTRIAGTGTMSVDPAANPSNNISCTLIATQI